MYTTSSTRKWPELCLVFRSLLFLIVIPAAVSGQKLATLEIGFRHAAAGLTLPVETSLDAITLVPDSVLALERVIGKKRTDIPFQIISGPERKIAFFVNDLEKGSRYELVRVNGRKRIPAEMHATTSDGTLTLRAGDRNLLRYQFGTMLPPAGVKEVFKRSGFIHPLWSPGGEVLTRIQPPDHYHHYGIWNPWTHALFEGDTVDFWNLNARQGTVRFAGLVSVVEGPVFAAYSALHEHVVFKNGTEKTAITELQTVRVHAPAGRNYYVADVTVQMNCPGNAIRLLEYRYGGFGWRATEAWTKENSRVLTSEGKSRQDADGSTARWCRIEGTTDGKTSGIVLMSYPTNYNHPEPLRIWPENSNRNRGDMFANFSPTKNMDWSLEPGRNYVLRYRLIVFDDQFTKEQAESAWQHFAAPPLVKVTVTK